MLLTDLEENLKVLFTFFMLFLLLDFFICHNMHSGTQSVHMYCLLKYPKISDVNIWHGQSHRYEKS